MKFTGNYGGATMNSDPERPGDFTREKAEYTVSRLMTEQKNRAAEGLHRLACIVRTRATQNNGEIGPYRNRAAARLDSMATYVRGADFPTMLRDAGQLARRRPEVVIGGTIVTGLLVAGFLRVSKRSAAEPWSAAGRWVDALQKSAQVVSSAADTLRKDLGARGWSPEAVVEKVSGSQLGKSIASVSDRVRGRQ